MIIAIDFTTMEEEEKQKDISNIPRLRTFETDISNYVKKKGLSLVGIASDQAKFKGLEFQEENRGGLFSIKTIALLVIVLILLGSGFLFLFFNKGDKFSPSFVLEEQLLASDEKIEIIVDPGDSRKFLKDVKAAIETNAGANKLVNILMLEKSQDGSKKTISAEKFFTLTEIKPPAELMDSFNDEGLMLSKVYLSNNWPVLIFKLSSYNYAFSGMLKWENTIVNDLSGIFPNVDTNQTENLFLDKVIQNHDARVLKSAEGKAILAYSFINREYLVITSDIEPIQEIFRRFVPQ